MNMLYKVATGVVWWVNFQTFTVSPELRSPCPYRFPQITRHMAVRYGPKHVKAWHTNYPVYVIICELPSVLPCYS